MGTSNDQKRNQWPKLSEFGILWSIVGVKKRFQTFFVKCYDDVIRVRNPQNRDLWPNYSMMTNFHQF